MTSHSFTQHLKSWCNLMVVLNQGHINIFLFHSAVNGFAWSKMYCLVIVKVKIRVSDTEIEFLNF